MHIGFSEKYQHCVGLLQNTQILKYNINNAEKSINLLIAICTY